MQIRYAITKRAEMSGSPGLEPQIYGWDLTAGTVTQYFTVLADGTAQPVQFTNSVSSSMLVALMFR